MKCFASFLPILLLIVVVRNTNGKPKKNRALMAHVMQDHMKEHIHNKKVLEEIETQDAENHAMDVPEHRGHVTAHHNAEAELLLEELEARENEMEKHGAKLDGVDVQLPDKNKGKKHTALRDLIEKLNSRNPRMDIDLSNEKSSLNSRRRRTVSIEADSRWDKGIVPYLMTELSTDDAAHVRHMMDIWEYFSMFQFVPWTETTQADYGLDHNTFINMIDEDGCYSGVGTARDYSAGYYDVSCCTGTTCVHELGHSLGLGHEHQNPFRDDYEQMLYENMKPDYRFSTLLQFQPKNVEFDTVDYSSVMHYWFMAFHENYQNVLKLYNSDFEYQLDPWAGVNLYYETNQLHKIYDISTDKCVDFTTPCTRGGYVSHVGGVCQCRCPTGMDPASGCTQRQATVVSTTTWPSGSYALLKPDDDCPAGFTTGSVYHATSGYSWMSEYDDAAGDMDWHSADGFCTITHEFCVRDETVSSSATWDKGHYCILKGANSDCPADFEEGQIMFDDNTEYAATTSTGSLPDGVFTGDTIMKFCCRADGVAMRPMDMPTADGPFILFNYESDCQTVAGMNYRKEEFSFRNMNSQPVVFGTSGTAPRTYVYSDQLTMAVYFCYYTPVQYDCGAVITLSDDSPNQYISSPNYPAVYPDNKQCTWSVEAPVGSYIILKFESLDLELSPNGDCADSVQVRHGSPGNEGQRYCGDTADQTFISESNYVNVYLHTDYMTSSNTGFSAKVSLLKPDIQPECVNSGQNPECDNWAANGQCEANTVYMALYCEKSCDLCIQGLCYTNEGRKGSYSGTKAVTRHYQDCLPWSEATPCPHHPFEDGDLEDALDSNYCRNPGHGTSPWCYTGIDNCDRDYCDVCDKYTCVDAFSDCSEIGAEMGFCAEHGDDCKLTCGTCVVCENDETSCDYWASIGECDANPGYMLKNCKAACGVCQPEPCEDTLPDCQSQIDTQVNFCDVNPGNDAARCAVTCGTCPTPQSTMTCAPPPTLADSSYSPIQTEYAVGETVTYECTNSPADQKERVCSSSGSWEPELNFICGTCPDGFEYKAGGCFKFVDVFTTFALAEDHCSGIGAFLTTAADTETETVLRDEVAEQEYGDIEFWVQNADSVECQYLANNKYTYDGTVAVTETDAQCVPWADLSYSYITDENFPDGSVTAAQNYCRNPDGGKERPWCFKSTSGSWRHCVVGIPNCDVTCANVQGSCDYWASIGECDANPSYMNGNCKKACGICQNPEEAFCDEMTETTRTTTDCNNLNPFVCQYQPAVREICVDQDPASCASHLSDRPSACVDFPNYAKAKCPRSCGHCSDANANIASTVTCSDPASQGDFTLVTGGATVAVGGVYEYACASGYVLASGNLVRRCTESGSLSGSPPVCQPAAAVDTLSNDVEIRNRLSIAGSDLVYIGDNDNLRLPKNGMLKQWQFYSTTEGSMELHVWREVADKSFTLIGRNTVPVAREWRIQTIDVDSADQIAVQANDVIGFLFNGPSKGGVAYDRCTDALTAEGTSVYQSSSTYALGDLSVDTTYSFTDIPSFLHSNVYNRCRIYSINALVGP